MDHELGKPLRSWRWPIISEEQGRASSSRPGNHTETYLKPDRRKRSCCNWRGYRYLAILKPSNQNSLCSTHEASLETTLLSPADWQESVANWIKLCHGFWPQTISEMNFEEPKHLLLLADKIEETKTICQYCSKSTMVLRAGKPVYDGESRSRSVDTRLSVSRLQALF